ncbi:Uncharacterised protein [Mycobacteroides abscessus subsp. abscessus]|nr:Uncharacterised protein [Mycobacteroides abscessus subsp. abscessus]
MWQYAVSTSGYSAPTVSIARVQIAPALESTLVL